MRLLFFMGQFSFQNVVDQAMSLIEAASMDREKRIQNI